MPIEDPAMVVNHLTAPPAASAPLYAAADAGLDIAGFLVQAVWLVCVVGLAAFVIAIVTSAYRAIF
ncbi:MAG TPA: hypothetical protein VG795_05060 [Acidimicrobiia bacterium]|nr:hypothetical protein [Acidimicrobiia bacterium]